MLLLGSYVSVGSFQCSCRIPAAEPSRAAAQKEKEQRTSHHSMPWHAVGPFCALSFSNLMLLEFGVSVGSYQYSCRVAPAYSSRTATHKRQVKRRTVDPLFFFVGSSSTQCLQGGLYRSVWSCKCFCRSRHCNLARVDNRQKRNHGPTIFSLCSTHPSMWFLIGFLLECLIVQPLWSMSQQEALCGSSGGKREIVDEGCSRLLDAHVTPLFFSGTLSLRFAFMQMLQ